MKLKRILATLSASLALTASAVAAACTVTLVVPGMVCETCPITLNKALKKIPGIQKIDVKFEQKQIVVTYDDARTNVEALIKATTDAGYPSHEQKAGK
jgi:mercuric ion binding protein